MRAVIQRVNYGRVVIEDRETANIGSGMVILLGVGPGDDEQKSAALAKKIAQLRIMEDAEGKMNLSL
ncbi:MAG TPA: D-aminoacyl-tRNA deacylase, partial [Anaerolineaceae bacterium]|nr:D-aminoacyl-tRNA deacylase [Anaerolineaceae bacterium]HQF68592.1 D-aminoacyl-tRNA deacylase [Anaerolineaceae bacterium]HQK05797.1 D-aminoacyl-tRNA deacylase [Anaerolineaceae bacterium]